MHNHHIDFTLNDAAITCVVPAHWTLHEMLGQVNALPGPYLACPEGDCCRCTVLLDGRAVCACHVLALEAAGCIVQTRAGVADHPVVTELQSLDGPCGSCIDAFALAAIDYLQTTPHAGQRGLDLGLAVIPCSCHVDQHVRRVIQGMARRGREHGA